MNGISMIVPERPLIQPLGDAGLLVRFGSQLDDRANRRALGFARLLAEAPIDGVLEVVPSLVSVFLRYDPLKSRFAAIAGELRLRMGFADDESVTAQHRIAVAFGGVDGPDLGEVAAALGLDEAGYVARHNASVLRVLTTGFAPGFVYCGFHPDDLVVPRRPTVRPMVRAGSVLFAAGQTAIAATDIPTGWHVIGRTDFRNFQPDAKPPTRLMAGDAIQFEVL